MASSSAMSGDDEFPLVAYQIKVVTPVAAPLSNVKSKRSQTKSSSSSSSMTLSPSPSWQVYRDDDTAFRQLAHVRVNFRGNHLLDGCMTKLVDHVNKLVSRQHTKEVQQREQEQERQLKRERNAAAARKSQAQTAASRAKANAAHTTGRPKKSLGKASAPPLPPLPKPVTLTWTDGVLLIDRDDVQRNIALVDFILRPWHELDVRSGDQLVLILMPYKDDGDIDEDVSGSRNSSSRGASGGKAQWSFRPYRNYMTYNARHEAVHSRSGKVVTLSTVDYLTMLCCKPTFAHTHARVTAGGGSGTGGAQFECKAGHAGNGSAGSGVCGSGGNDTDAQIREMRACAQAALAYWQRAERERRRERDEAMSQSFTSEKRRDKCADYYDSHDVCDSGMIDGLTAEIRLLDEVLTLTADERAARRRAILTTLKKGL